MGPSRGQEDEDTGLTDRRDGGHRFRVHPYPPTHWLHPQIRGFPSKTMLAVLQTQDNRPDLHIPPRRGPPGQASAQS
ncbi:hypothetical protein SKAU_G00242490 [Synaphobranchus kaupii]|uniref:Uncharacterized protein n=1 Tax=Synaphobranchus kaupii TaxID=118154 RepID=A0A9Q1F7Z0_SYNKA|nr:hypothetical protein SKAU_G00242490 [Synaphobranchus kaupii]